MKDEYLMTSTAPTTPTAEMHDFDGIAVILAAHGSTRRPDANAVISAHAAQMRKTGPFQHISTAFLIGDQPPSALKQQGSTRTVLIVPFMMSDGFLADELSSQIADTLSLPSPDDRHAPRIIVTPPVGTHKGITQLARHAGEKALAGAGFDARKSTLVICAHGSKGRPESRLAAEAHTDRLRGSGAFAHVVLAMLEEPPVLNEVLADIKGPAAVVGLFAAPGGHAIDDVKEAINQNRNREIIDAGPVGIDPRMADIAVMRALDALGG